MKRRMIALVLMVVLLMGVFAPTARSVDRFSPVRVYQGQFDDVDDLAWYYEPVKALYELGLIDGQSETLFVPDSDMTVAEILTMAARIRSLYQHGDSETGPAGYGGESWYLPYVSYLQGQSVIALEFDGAYGRSATRAETAHVLARTLPWDFFVPINRTVVSAGYTSGNYITDVSDATPYKDDILLLYQWGVLSGMDPSGSFQPNGTVLRSQAAAMVTRLVDSDLRIHLPWEYASAYSRSGTTMRDLVDSAGVFYDAPASDDLAAIDADVRYMLSRGERTITLNYPPHSLSREEIDRLTQAFLSTVRLYVEQTYNNILCSYSIRSGLVTIVFSSSLYDDSEIEAYRSATMVHAIQVHDEMWASGIITPDMTEYDKARVYFTWLCDHCRYDYASNDSSMSHSGYRAFAEGLAVCDGYTAAYNLLLKLEGIQCTTASTETHIWTVAELDGHTYHIDPTWGDRTGSIAYRYFAMTEADAMARFV